MGTLLPCLNQGIYFCNILESSGDLVHVSRVHRIRTSAPWVGSQSPSIMVSG